MNTPGHVVINLAFQGKKGSRKLIAPIVAGALVPDLPMFVFYAWQKFQGVSESRIWQVEYFRESWQNFIDLFNSFPLSALGWIAAPTTVQPRSLAALVQLAKLRGCTVVGTAGSAAKLDYLPTIGVDHPVNYRTTDFASEWKRLFPKNPPDVIFDSIGGATARKGRALLGAGGRIVLYGVAEMAGPKKSLFRSLKTVMSFGLIHSLSLLSKSQSVLGVNLLQIADSRVEILQYCMGQVLELVKAGKLKADGKVYPVEDLAAAHEHLGLRKSIGKVAVEWTNSV